MKTAATVFFRNLWFGTLIGSVCWAAPGPIGVALMEQLDLLPVLKDGVRCEQFSSRSRQGGNEKDDSGTTLYQSGSEYVLFESSRPGCIYRFWITYVFYSPWVLRFYFDGETTPRINMPLSEFFSGTVPPFVSPLVRSFWSSAGGYVSYVPIPFRKSLKVTISPYNEDQLFWFNITYHTYDNDDGVVTWTGNENLQNVIAIWNNAGRDPKPTAGNLTRSSTLNLPGGQTTTLENLTGPGEIRSFKLRIPGESLQLLRNLTLQITWDGDSQPAVNAPLSEFFANHGGIWTVESLCIGRLSDGTYYCYFPMPYNVAASVRIRNNGSSAVSNVWYELQYRNYSAPRADVGYFHAIHREQANIRGNYLFADVQGQGHFVGVVHSFDARNAVQGDERFTLDNNGTPAVHGTGTEDYYNCGHAFAMGMLSRQCWGYLNGDPQSAYRFHLFDWVPFKQRGRFTIESLETASHWSTAFYYLKPSSGMVQTDMLDVGDAASESAHSYTIIGQTAVTSGSHLYEGESDAPVTDDGRSHTGSSQFTVSIRPTNSGVLLRRRLDQNVGRQTGRVYIDGAFAGVWYTPDTNTYRRWLDSEFLVDPRLTAGKDRIVVRIEHAPPAPAWHEARYWVFSMVPHATQPARLTCSAAPSRVVSNGPGVAVTTITATVRDANGVVVAGATPTVVFTMLAGKGSFLTSATVTAVGGRAQVVFRAGSGVSGSETIVASAAGMDPGSVTVDLVTNAAPGAPASLLCNGQVNPVNLMDFTPILSWTFQDPDGGDAQSAFHIIVADNDGDIRNDVGNIWNSGMVWGSHSSVRYYGPELDYGKTYYWKVRTWDALYAPGLFAAPASFSMTTGGDYALRFNGESLVYLTNYPQLNLTGNAATVECWVRCRQHRYSGLVYGHLWGSWALWLDNGNPAFTGTFNGNKVDVASSQRIPLNEWVHVAGCYDGSSMRIYVNGQLMGSRAQSGRLEDENDREYNLGHGGWPGGLVGDMDEVRISNVSRYSGSSFAVPTAPFVPDASTRALWRFNEGKGLYVRDVTGQLVGTLRDAPQWVAGRFYDTGQNQPPTVTLISPVTGSTYTAPATVNLTATASDMDGTIVYVRFYSGSTLLNTDSVSPYAYSWTGVGAGNYALRAVAQDNQGATSTSTVVNITVYSSGTPANQPPVVSLTSPVNGSTYTAPTNITLAATATDPDGGITAVRFYSGTTLLNLDTASPYTYTWTGVSSGTYQLYATATDDRGAVSTSAVVSVTVYPPNQPPTVTMTSPVNNSTHTAPATLNLAATASDPDGTIANVRFYRGTTLLNTDTASPYEYTWANVSSGTYQLRAVAQDNQGATSTSTVVTVTVLSSETPPVWYTLITAVNPANGGTVSPASGTYLAGSQIQVAATPSTNYTFSNWSGDITGTNPTVTITMDADKSITANFTYVPPANSSPTVSITSPQDGATYTAPASITITATAADSDGSVAVVRFYSGMTLLGADSTSPYEYTWNNVAAGVYFLTAYAEDDHGAVGTSGVIGVSVSSPVYYTLTVTANPATGGSISVNPAPTGGGYLTGTQVSLTATPNAGYEFAGWSGNITGSSTTNPMVVVMDANKTLTANFRAVQVPQPSQPELQPGEVRISGGPGGYVDANVNPNVVIRFRRATAGMVTVRIYDLRGRLVEEKNKDGSGESDDEITWNAAGMPAGVYIIQTSGGGLADKKKTAILK